MKYDEIEEYLGNNPRCKINFREYTESMTGIRREILSIVGFDVVTYIRGNEFLDKEKIYKYYGDLENFEKYLIYPYLRIVIKAPDGQDIFTGSEEKEYYVLHLNRVYFTSNLQQIDLYTTKVNESVMGALKPWQ